LEIVTGREKQPVALRGTGIYRFAVQERFAFGGATGADTAEIPVINLMDRELTLSIGLSSPLTGEKSLLLPPKGAVGLKLGLEKRHYTEKFTEVTVSDGSAVRAVRVELPPPPALLEWASEDAEIDLGAIPKRQIPRPEFELRNRGATRATVEIRETEGGLALAKGQASRFDLLPGKSTVVKTVWRLSENLGAVSSGLIASHGGLDHPLRVRGLVVEPPVAAQEKVSEAPPKPKDPQSPPVNVLSETEQNDLNRRMPADIDYTPGTGGVDLTWKYAGPEPVLFWLEKKVVERSKAGLEDAFERRLQVPQDLPQPETTEKWVPIFPSEADIRKLEDGTWRGSVYGLKPGHHDVRIATRNPPNGSRIDYSEFAVRVFPPPPNPLWKWLAGAFGVLCLLYLLRKRLRRLFVRDPQQI
jgi:hypothetical protein